MCAGLKQVWVRDDNTLEQLSSWIDGDMNITCYYYYYYYILVVCVSVSVCSIPCVCMCVYDKCVLFRARVCVRVCVRVSMLCTIDACGSLNRGHSFFSALGYLYISKWSLECCYLCVCVCAYAPARVCFSSVRTGTVTEIDVWLIQLQ